MYVSRLTWTHDRLPPSPEYWDYRRVLARSADIYIFFKASQPCRAEHIQDPSLEEDPVSVGALTQGDSHTNHTRKPLGFLRSCAVRGLQEQPAVLRAHGSSRK